MADLQMPEGWQWVTIADIADDISDRVDNPSESGFERFVGLEHMEGGSLQISKWGSTHDVTSAMKLFQRGDVLFARRNAYLKRASMADFDGVCSGDAIVLREKPDALYPGFLPLVLNTDIFWDYAIAHAAGSMSKRVKVRDLMGYEFALPPLDEQRRIAEILWAAEETIELYTIAQHQSEKALHSTIFHLMQHGIGEFRLQETDGVTCPEHWQVKRLEDIALVERGKFAHRPRNLPKFYGGPYPFVQTGDVAASKGMLEAYEQTLSEEGKAISRSFEPGSILITIAAVIGRTTVTQFEVWCTDSVVGIVPDSDVNVYFLEFYLRTLQSHLENRVATQTAQKNINLKKLRPLLVPVPPPSEQAQIADILFDMQKRVHELEQHTEGIQTLKQSLVNDMLLAPAQAETEVS
jgi:type I restriction enzyme S subunit